MLDLRAPRRSAHASIRGYLYQALLGVERWLELGSGEGPGGAADALLCEGDEDLDRVIRGEGDGRARIQTSEQVKDYSGSLGISDRVVRETLARFVVHWVDLRRRDDGRCFLFTTTAPRRAPREGIDLLAIWSDPDRRPEAIDGVRRWTRFLAAGTSGGGEGAAEDLEEALHWLDAQDVWDAFFEAVDWGFGAPDLHSTRSKVAGLLGARDVPPPLRETLTDRLLSRVLDASIQDDPEDRVLTAGDLDDLLELTEKELLDWTKTDEAVQLRQTFDEEKALRLLLSPGRGELSAGTPPPSELLTACYEVVPFEETGREHELAELTAWCAADAPASVFLLHGQGGTGKTRLLIEWCRRLRHQGWHAGFLDRYAQLPSLDPLFEGTTPRLVVIDYGETRPDLVAPILHRLDRWSETGGPTIRVALLARTDGTWWRLLQEQDERIGHLARSAPDPFEVTPLVPAEDERAAFVARAMSAYAAARGIPIPEPPAEADYAHERYQRALYLHVDALLQVLRAAEPGVETSQPGGDEPNPFAEILKHERRAWWRLLEGADSQTVPGSTIRTADRSMAVITLVKGATSEAEAAAHFGLAVPSADPATRTSLLDLFHRLYPASDGQWIAPLEPDLLGEELVRQVLSEDVVLLEVVLDASSKRQTQDALVIVGRILSDEAVPVILAQNVYGRIGGYPYLPVSLRDAMASAIQRLLDQHRKEHPDPGEADLAERLRFLNNLSNSLADLGRLEEALANIEEAVDISRELCHSDQGGLTRQLATSLRNLSRRLSALGHPQKALAAIEESVDMLRGLAGMRAEELDLDLATSLNILSICLANVDREEEALTVAEESVGLYRNLDRKRLQDVGSQFAASLNNLSTRLAVLGHWKDSLTPIEEAVALRRELARVRPEVFDPDLATSLNSLGIRLSDVGRREESLAAAEESVSILRGLAHDRPEVFGSDLAMSLNSLSNRLADLNRREEALRVSEEGVRTLAPHFSDLPRAFETRMDKMLLVYRKRCVQTDTPPDEALIGPIRDSLARLDDDSDPSSLLVLRNLVS